MSALQPRNYPDIRFFAAIIELIGPPLIMID
jgi:hypothetical protein